MQIIQDISEDIDKKLHCSKRYIKTAIKYKGINDPVANVYYQLSVNEMNDVNKLHEVVVNIIDTYKKENGEPHVEMLAIYNFIHEREIDKTKHIKLMWEMYKT